MACDCAHDDGCTSAVTLPDDLPPPYSFDEASGSSSVAQPTHSNSRSGVSSPSSSSGSSESDSSDPSQNLSYGERIIRKIKEKLKGSPEPEKGGKKETSSKKPVTVRVASTNTKPSSKPQQPPSRARQPSLAETLMFGFASASYSYSAYTTTSWTTATGEGARLGLKSLASHAPLLAVLPRFLDSDTFDLERDFTALREALAYSPEPSPLPILERDEVLAAQAALIAREASLDAKGEVRTRKAVVGPGKHFSKKGLDELHPANLSSLRCDEIGSGKALICRIASKCARTVAVALVVEDASGRFAPIQLHHLAPCEAQHLEDQFALGLHFAIKEPSIRSSCDGFVIRIESPSDFFRLLPSSPLLANIPFPPPRRLPVIRRSSAQQKDEGNRLFAQRRFAAARDAYSLALDDKEVDNSLRITLLANRAAVLLKLKLFNAALADCTTALPLGPSLQLKILYRAATATYALQRFDAASEHLALLLQLSPDDLDAEDLYRRTQVRLVEAARGEYDWPFLFARAAQVDTLDVADFASDAFEVKEIAGRGRGLVARRRIEPGELLMVQKPLAMGMPAPKRLSYVVGANLFTETMDPYSMGDLVAHMAERMGDDEWIRRRVLSLYAGDEKMLEPVGTSSSPAIDISRLEGIATFNAFHTESLAQKAMALSPSEEAAQDIHAPSSLYDLPSMLNHSCIGNVSYSFLADAFFLRARLTIQPGDELVDSYVDSLEGLAQRADKLDKHRFVCRCRLCDWDREDGEQAGRERERLASQLGELTDRIHGVQAQDPAPLFHTIRAFIDQIQATYKPSRPNLRPALYSAFRLLGATLATLEKHEEAIEVEMRALVALGAEFEGEKEVARLVEVPSVGDMNSVLSSLFIAAQYQKLQRMDAVRNWIEIARRIERGQAGEAVFEARYADWAQKTNLKLS